MLVDQIRVCDNFLLAVHKGFIEQEREDSSLAQYRHQQEQERQRRLELQAAEETERARQREAEEQAQREAAEAERKAAADAERARQREAEEQARREAAEAERKAAAETEEKASETTSGRLGALTGALLGEIQVPLSEEKRKEKVKGKGTEEEPFGPFPTKPQGLMNCKEGTYFFTKQYRKKYKGQLLEEPGYLLSRYGPIRINSKGIKTCSKPNAEKIVSEQDLEARNTKFE